DPSVLWAPCCQMDDARLPIFNIQAGDSSVFGRGEYSQSVEPSNPVRRLPTLLELGSDQAIAGIAGSVAPLRERSFIASLLYLEPHNALFFPLGSIYLRSASPAASIAIGWTARIGRPRRRSAWPPNMKHRGSPSIWFRRSHR